MTGRARLARLLESSAFRQARAHAAEIIDDAPALRGLLADVEAKEGVFDAPSCRVALDIACAVVEAHVDGLETVGVGDGAAADEARLRLVIAGLSFVAAAASQRTPPGVDDAEILRWIRRVVLNQPGSRGITGGSSGVRGFEKSPLPALTRPPV